MASIRLARIEEEGRWHNKEARRFLERFLEFDSIDSASAVWRDVGQLIDKEVVNTRFIGCFLFSVSDPTSSASARGQVALLWLDCCTWGASFYRRLAELIEQYQGRQMAEEGASAPYCLNMAAQFWLEHSPYVSAFVMTGRLPN